MDSIDWQPSLRPPDPAIQVLKATTTSINSLFVNTRGAI